MIRRVLLLVCLLFSAQAFALLPTGYQYRGQYSSGAVPSSATCEAAADVDMGILQAASSVDNYVRTGSCGPFNSSNQATYPYNEVKRVGGAIGSGNAIVNRSPGASCPANSTAVTGGCQCNQGFDEIGGQCKPHENKCTAKTGVVGVTNWTQGFSRTPDEGDTRGVGGVYPPPADGNVCDSGCNVSIQTSGPGVNYYVSQQPTANGLYRRSVDYPNIGLGTECTASAKDAPAQPSTPEPPCPGTVGTVGSVTVCIGTAAKPVTDAPIDRPGSTPVAGNPVAGAKPSSGEGSGSGGAGRTPATGSGGNAGGGAAAAAGGKGGGAGGTSDGTGIGAKAPDGKEPTPCGAPGQPDCSVKVNEKGTPDGVGTTYDMAKAKLDETKGKNDEQLAKVSGTGDKGFFEPVRSMFWAPPIAACETFDLPQQVGGLKLDACGVVDGVRMAMAFVWAGAGLFLCLGMVKRSF